MKLACLRRLLKILVKVSRDGKHNVCKKLKFSKISFMSLKSGEVEGTDVKEDVTEPTPIGAPRCN